MQFVFTPHSSDYNYCSNNMLFFLMMMQHYSSQELLVFMVQYHSFLQFFLISGILIFILRAAEQWKRSELNNIWTHKKCDTWIWKVIHHTFMLWIFNATYVLESFQVTVVLSPGLRRHSETCFIKIHLDDLWPLLRIIHRWQTWEIDWFPAFWQRVELAATKKERKAILKVEH